MTRRPKPWELDRTAKPKGMNRIEWRWLSKGFRQGGYRFESVNFYRVEKK